MESHLSEAELDTLAQELDAEINALDEQIGFIPVSRHNPANLLPEKYRAQLAGIHVTRDTIWHQPLSAMA